MSKSDSPGILGITGEEELLELVGAAKARIAYMAPGITERLAEVIADRWELLGPDAVKVTLDVDPEVCRMGYGTIEGLELLHETADLLGTTIRRQPGLRIGVVLIDGQAVIFSPTPLLIEGGADQSHRNSVWLGAVAPWFEQELGIGRDSATCDNGPPTHEHEPGEQVVDEITLQSAKKDLEENPPLRFDVTQRLRVFNAKFEFVEFELRGGALDRKTVPIPSSLLGLASHPETQALLRSTFKLVGELPDVSPTKLIDTKNAIAKKYLVPLKGFGQVILRKLKEQFENRVQEFEKEITEFMDKANRILDDAVEANRQKLVQALLPGVKSSIPERWLKFLGPEPTQEQVMGKLDSELHKIFSRSRLKLRPRVRLVFKGVTYELLTNPRFSQTVKDAFPGMNVFHDEFDAMRYDNDRNLSEELFRSSSSGTKMHRPG
jgi:hypothetical protein